MTQFLLIGAGGFFGAIARYWLAGLIQELSGRGDFPLGTLAVNIIGCFLIGFLAYAAGMYGLLRPEVRLFLLVGFIGSFTTYSTFELEVMNLVEGGSYLYAALNLLAHVTLGAAAVWIGQVLAQFVWR